MDFELLVWGDGTTRLVYWDYRHGHDVVFILGDDNKAYTEDDQDVRTEVDLVDVLRQLAALKT